MARKISAEQFIEICKAYHNKYRSKYDLLPYDYTKTIYKVMKNSPIIITCPYHGDFELKDACNHSNGNHTGCPECGKIISRKKRLLSSEEFFNKCKSIHKNSDGSPKYDYSKSKYNGYSNQITYWCPNCKQYVTQIALNHIKGEQCIGCYRKNHIPENKFSTKTFIRRVKETHPNKEYDFSRTNYVNRDTYVTIGCPIHGYFETHPGNFINKSRNSDCPKCSQERLQKIQTSNKEKQLVSIIQKHYTNLSILENERFKISNQSNHQYELDIYIPEIKLGIEYNGIYWHSNKVKSDDYHFEKKQAFESIGIRCFMLFESDDIKDIITKQLIPYIDRLMLPLNKRKQLSAGKYNYNYYSVLDFCSDDMVIIGFEPHKLYYSGTCQISKDFYSPDIITHNCISDAGILVVT